MTGLDSFPTAYTPLESLLLFQSLRVDGVKSISFGRISDQLQNIALVHNDPTFDRGRLSPDALHQLYLRLLKDEVKQDLERQDVKLVNGDASPGSRKRKAASPSLPTVNEAAQHAHLIPRLVDRLYARYREIVVRRLREEERKFTTLTREIGEIQSGQWDERLQRRQAPSRHQSPRPSSSAHTQSNLARSDTAQVSAQSSPNLAPDASLKSHEKTAPEPPKRYTQAKIDDMINHGPEPQYSPGGHRRQSSNTVLPPLAEMAAQSSGYGGTAQIPGPVSAQAGPIHANSPHTLGQASPAGNQPPFPSHHPNARSGPTTNSHPQQTLSRPSSSHRPILPPLPGMKNSPTPPNASPSIHGHPLQPHSHPSQHFAQQPHHMPSAGNLSPTGYPGLQAAPHTPAYYQQPTFSDRRTSYPTQQHTPTFQSPVHHAAGYMVPPYQVGPMESANAVQQQQGHAPHVPVQGMRPLSYVPNAHQGPSTAPRTAPPAKSRLVSNILSALATPTRPTAKPLWRSNVRPSTLAAPVLRESPTIEPLSPTLGRVKSPTRETRRTHHRNATPPEQPTPVEARPKTRTSRRKQTVRDRSPHSVVSSLADDSALRTRSQSVSTVAGLSHVMDDRPGSRGGVKVEPSTPADNMEDADPMTAAVGTPASGPMTRKRRGTLQSVPLPPSKRKRQESPTVGTDDLDDSATPPPRSDKVIATRNFARMAATLMDDIHSHKNAYRFERPVKDKEAPGYSDIVYRRQDLKSIRAAITAGTRAVTAATNNTDSPGGTPTASASRGVDTSAVLELDRSLDVIPPKAIVNGAQLEKELMRMFANAFMFNPGEDGVAGITKEFYQDVEQKISDWRNIEREKTGN